SLTEELNRRLPVDEIAELLLVRGEEPVGDLVGRLLEDREARAEPFDEPANRARPPDAIDDDFRDRQVDADRFVAPAPADFENDLAALPVESAPQDRPDLLGDRAVERGLVEELQPDQDLAEAQAVSGEPRLGALDDVFRQGAVADQVGAQTDLGLVGRGENYDAPVQIDPPVPRTAFDRQRAGDPVALDRREDLR